MCDIHCMFIGDCCYDYLMECDNREFVMSSALAEQSYFYQYHKQYSYCKQSDFEDIKGYVRQISSCPEGKDEMTDLCEGKDGGNLFSWYIHVTARGILFSNVYCAACHRIRLQEVEIATARYVMKCINELDVKVQLVPFQLNFRCAGHIGKVANRYKGLSRKCVCNPDHKKKYVYL